MRIRRVAVVASACAVAASLAASCGGGSAQPAQALQATCGSCGDTEGASLASQLAAAADVSTQPSWSDAAKFIVEKTTGAMIGNLPSPLGKLSQVLLDFFNSGGASASPLDLLKQQLDAIQGQLHDLQKTMDLALQVATETEAATLAANVKSLRDTVMAAQGDLMEAFSYAGQPSKKAVVEERIAQVKAAVDGMLKAKTLVVPEAILGSAITPGVPSLYQVLGKVMTHNHQYIFTWRDSAALDNVFQYLTYLQALQYNLIVQVFTMEGSSPDQIYQRFSQDYLGDRSSFSFTATDVSYTPARGWLHDELAAELTRVPAGLMIDTRTGLEWSTDVPGGARDFTLNRGGPGVPQCPPDGHSEPPPACVTDPHYSLGPTQKEWTQQRYPGSPADQLANALTARGYGVASSWNLPTTDQLDSLFTGYSKSDGSAKQWLEQRSNDPKPATCTPVTAGADAAVKSSDTCLWPATTMWPVPARASDTPGGQLIKNVYGCHGSGLSYRCDALYRSFPYGWRYEFLSTTAGSNVTCDLVTPVLRWDHHDSSPSGPTWNPPGSASCSGALVLVRQLAGERYYF